MIYICGDTHGLYDFNHIRDYFESKNVTRSDILLILGDAGILWNPNHPYIDEYEALGLTVLYIDGNHENFDMINACPIVTKHGAKMHKVSEHIFHILRGEVATIEGSTFFCMGGASSVDKHLRTEGVSWWPDEDITEDDYQNARKNLDKNNWTVDYVLSHCCPENVNQFMFRHQYSGDINTEYLYALYKDLYFREWFFGHYHEDREYRYGNTVFTLLYQEIRIIPETQIKNN